MSSLPRPSKILCAGRNYRAHAEEMGTDVPDEPLLFLKPPSSVIGPGEPIRIPAGVGRVDHEGEIGVVLGRRGRNIPPERAFEYVAGVFPANDVTARDLQRRDSQWTRAKGFDTFCPAGRPETVDESRWAGLVVLTRVNGEVRQEGAVSDLAYSLPDLLAYASTIMTLEPGDFLLTGSPPGVGPLQAGDEVEVEIPGVGSVRNPVHEEGE